MSDFKQRLCNTVVDTAGNSAADTIESLTAERDALRNELATVRANAERSLSGRGHGERCYYCDNKCNALAANPGEWPVALCHADEPGVVKWHCTGCVSERLTWGEARGWR